MFATRDESSLEPPRRIALDPPLDPELLDAPEPLELPDPLEGDDLGGGADLTGCDCGIEEVGASRVLEPAVEDELDPVLGGASPLVVVVRGIAWAAAEMGMASPVAVTMI